MLSYKFKDVLLTYVGKKHIRGKPQRIWIRNTALFLANFRISNLRTGHYGNLRICNLRINHHKFADLRFVD